MQHPATSQRRTERGYILLTLMLFVALLTVAALAIAPTITFEIQRDREEELIHRGTQYSRAIRSYYKKVGRYPTSLTDLDDTNDQRFLRKHYKDPVTGKDFRLLHFSEVQMMSMGGGMTGATPVSSMTTGGSATATTGGGFSLGPSASQPTSTSTQNSASNSSNSASSSSTETPDGQGGLASGQPQLVGGPIVGVISTSKAKSIREFGGKNHYNQWQFIYDPGLDRTTGLINTPAQPPLQNAVNLNAQTSPSTQPLGTNPTGSSSPFSSGPATTTPAPQPSQPSTPQN
jgi:type II secretory pathway pseudopilin PulG